MPHVKGLQILNDCEENLKLVRKLPDWAAFCWNRKVTETLNSSQDFPSFQELTTFMSMEAEIACNPITSFHALHSSEQTIEDHNLRDQRGNRASVFSTQAATSGVNQRPPCVFCQDSKHQIHACPNFISKSLDERREYVKERRPLLWMYETWPQCERLSTLSLL